MVNFNNPTVIQQDFSALRDFWHTMNGLFIWEFVTTLDYELSIIRGRRPYRWTIWIYSITRLAALVAVITAFIGLDVTTRYNCQAWVTLGLFFGYLSIAAASLLIVLRIIAIWNRTKVIVVIAAGVWVINVLVMIQGLVRVRSAWGPALGDCVAFSIDSSKPNIIVTLITDITLLLTMLVGLLRQRIRSGDVFGIASLLWKQGLIWLLLATIAEVPPAVFIILNLNDPLNMIFQHFSVIVLSIAATRMYRSLVDFVSGSTGIVSDSLQKGNIRGSGSKRNPSAPTPPSLIEMPVAVHAAHELSPTSRTSHYGSEISTDRKPVQKPHEFSLDNDVESAIEKRV